MERHGKTMVRFCIFVIYYTIEQVQKWCVCVCVCVCKKNTKINTQLNKHGTYIVSDGKTPWYFFAFLLHTTL